jgi:hypothetical protein
MAVAVFSYADWSARYPELVAKVTEPLATAYFLEAEIYLDNTDESVVQDVARRTLLFNMLVAHIAACNGAASPAGVGVGRISSATQGSVSVSLDFNVPAGTAAWYALTKYGAAYWAATALYRGMNYIPGEQPSLDVPGAGWLR